MNNLAYFAIFVLILVNFSPSSKAVKVTLLHYNDLAGHFHAWKSAPLFERCQSQTEECYGGIARLASKLTEERELGEQDGSVITIMAGNFVGSYWMSALKDSWKQMAKFLNPITFNDTSSSTALVPDIMTLGMREFDAGLSQTNDFLDELLPVPAKKVLLTNVECSFGERFCDLIVKSRRLRVSKDGDENALDIPVVGFMAPLVMALSQPGDLHFNDVVTSLKNEITKEFPGSDCIAVGQGPIALIKSMIDNIPQIKIVVSSGHENDNEIEEYPIKYRDSWILRAGRNGKSIGKFAFNFDESSRIINGEGTLIEIKTREITEDENVRHVLREFNEEVKPLIENKIGYSVSNISWRKGCWKRECNLGNIVTDAMVKCAYTRNTDKENAPFGFSSFWHSKAFKLNIRNFKKRINELDIHDWLPNHNRPVHVKISGQKLWKIFERSASGLGKKRQVIDELEDRQLNPDRMPPDWDNFSKFQVDEENYKLQSLRVYGNATEDSTFPTYIDVRKNYNTKFHVIIPSFIFNGRLVYKDIFHETEQVKDLTDDLYDDQCVKNYIAKNQFFANGYEERILIDENISDDEDPTTARTRRTTTTSNRESTTSHYLEPDYFCQNNVENVALTVTLTLLIFIFICGLGLTIYRVILLKWWTRRQFQYQENNSPSSSIQNEKHVFQY